jgi:serine/threonine-protein kinase
MAELTAEQIGQRAFELNLLDEQDLNDIWSQFGRRNISGDDFIQALLRRELMTNYQLERLLKGERGGFFYGPYKVLYRVATGTFARVYRAADKNSDRVVALKVLRKRYSDNKEQSEQFYREGKIGCSLRHPNIVPIYDVVSDGLTHYIVMEFVEGRNLREFVRGRHKLSPEEAVKLTIDMTQGLQYAHERGVTHRDLKMTNVLISARGEAKLADFGLAAAGDTITDTQLANHPNPRTVDYAGLERATGVRNDDTRSDIYFMGCMFYHMLIGRPALVETKERMQRLDKSRFQDVVPVHKADPSIPLVVAHVVNKAMSLDTDRRFQSPAELLLDLKIASQRLREGHDIDQSALEAEGASLAATAIQDLSVKQIPESLRSILLFVEPNSQFQDTFRTGLKRSGYRVHLVSDPQRALDRLEADVDSADCVIISGASLGREGLDAFNKLDEADETREVPAILLLSEDQAELAQAARSGPKRKVLSMPFKLKDLRAMVGEVVPPLRPIRKQKTAFRR